MDSVFSLKASRDSLSLLRTGRFPVAAFVGIVAVVCIAIIDLSDKSIASIADYIDRL